MANAGPSNEKKQSTISFFLKRSGTPLEEARQRESDKDEGPDKPEHFSGKKAKITRQFREEWLRSYSWLCFDRNAMTCSVCLNAGKSNPFTQGCNNFQNSTLTRHQSSKDHSDAIKLTELQKHFAVSSKNVIDLHEAKASDRRDSHIKQLRTVYVMAKRNCSTDMFCDLMSLQMLNYADTSTNVYTNHEAVYQMEECIYNVILTEQLDEIKNSPFYGIMVDETCDISTEKKLAVYIRYVEPKSGSVKVCFLGNEHINDCTAAGIETALLTFLRKKTLVADGDEDLYKFLGLGTDGASVMTGRLNGLGARLRRRIPALVQVHCVAHRLNLAVSQAGKHIPYMCDYHLNIGTMYRYFADSSVKYDKLRVLQETLHGNKKQVKEPTSVRWLSVESAVKMIYQNFDAIIMCFEDGNAQKDPKAVALHKFMASSLFILITALLVDVLCIITFLSLTFQKDLVNLSDVRSNIETTKATLETMKQGSRHVDCVLDKIGENSEGNKCEISGVQIQDNCQLRQRFISVRSKFIDKLIENLTDRFPQDDLDILECFDILFNPDRYPAVQKDIYQYGDAQLKSLLEHFAVYLQKDRIMNHFIMFKHYVCSFKGTVFGFTDLCRNIIRDKKDTFPDYCVLAQIASIIPVSSAPCERGFSIQNSIKTHPRNRISHERLQRLMMIKLQGPDVAEFDIEKAEKLFTSLKSRRK